METIKVMTPYLPDDERAQRLAKLRENERVDGTREENACSRPFT
jgi:hypothetical protein